MVINQDFDSFPSIFDLQTKIAEPETNNAQLARNITMCGAQTKSAKSEDDIATLADRQKKLFAGLYNYMLLREPTATWEPDIPLYTDVGTCAYLVPTHNKDNSIEFSLMAAPTFTTYADDHCFIVGILNADAFTRTTSFDNQGISNGDIRFSVFDYKGKSNPNRFRYLTSNTPAAIQNAIRAMFAEEKEAADGNTTTNHEVFYNLRSGFIFTNAISGDDNWVRQESAERSTFEFTLPALIPIPFNHNLTISKPVAANSCDYDTIKSAFVTSGVSPTANIDWLLKNPIFQAWHWALNDNSTHSIPTSIISHSFNSIRRLSVYKACTRSYRLIGADWASEVNNVPGLHQAIIANPKITGADIFPPTELANSLNLTLPTLEPPTPLDDIDITHTNRFIPQSLPSRPNSMSSTHNPPNPTNTPNHYHSAPITSTATGKSSTTTSHRIWSVFGVIDHSSRSREGEKSHKVLVADTDGMTLLSPSSSTNNKTPLIEAKSNYYLCAPLNGTFSNCVDGTSSSSQKHHTKTAAIAMSTLYKGRFDSFLDSSKGKPFTNNIKSSISRFFHFEIFQWIINGTLYQRPLKVDSIIDRFSITHLWSLLSTVDTDSARCPYFPPEGFQSYEEVKAIFASSKWLISQIFHSFWFKKTLIYKSICLLEQKCISRDFSSMWDNNSTFDKALASFVIINSLHNIWAHIAALASNMPEDELYPAQLSLDRDPEPRYCLLAPPVIDDAYFSAKLNVDLDSWFNRLDSNLDSCGLCGDNFMTTSHTKSEPLISPHRLFKSPGRRNKRKPRQIESSSSSSEDYDSDSPVKKRRKTKKKNPRSPKRNKEKTDDKDYGKGDKDAKSGKPVIANIGTHILNPVSPHSISSLLQRHKDNTKEMTPAIPTGKNFKGFNAHCRFCLPFLLGQSCEKKDCGYHLFVSSSMRGDHTDWSFFRQWIRDTDNQTCLTDKAFASVMGKK